MAIDLFSLRMNLETTGATQALGALKGLDTQGRTTAAGLGGVAGGMQKVNVEAKATEAATGAAAARFGFLGGAMTALGPVALGAGAGFLAFRAVVNATAPDADALRISMLRLDSASRLTGVSLAFLEGVSRRAQGTFKLSAIQSNELTTEIAKLTGKAGDIGQTSAALAAFLNVGAAQGMTAQQTLVAVRQAILGIDEGTDKLFQKNPSTIYREFAQSIGTTAGKLTDQQKAQALVNAAMEASIKVGDAYNRFLETAAGKAGIANAAHERLSAAIGRVFEPLRAYLSGVGADFLNWLADVGERVGRIGVGGGGLSGLAVRLGLALGGAGGKVNNWDDLDLSMQGVESGSSNSTTPPTPMSEEEKKRRRKAYIERVLGLANMDETMDVLGDLGSPFGQQGPMAVRGGPAGEFDNIIRPSGMFDQNPDETRRGNMLQRFREQVAREAAQVQRTFANLGTNLGMTLANGFAAAMAAGLQGKNVFKAFGSAILSGLGSIFTQMGSELLAYGVIMLNLLPFLSNPFTSGPAAIAAGAALVALGTVLGGIATGSGGGSGGGGGSVSRDRATNITLTADGAGGFTAPKSATGQSFKVVGYEDHGIQRVLGKTTAAAKRRNI